MTHTKDEALKLALDGQRHLVEILAENWRVWPAQKAVEQTCLGDVYCSTKGRDLMFGNHEIAVDQDSAVVTKEMWSTMRQTLAAQPAPVQEPVAWMHKETGLLRQANKAKGGDFEPNHWTPLYTTPPAAQQEPIAQDVQEKCRIEAVPAKGGLLPAAPVQGELVAWRFTGVAGFKRFVTDTQYKAFLPEVRAWYEPFKCASCATPPAAQRQWAGLTPTERKQIEKRYVFVEDAIRLTEAKLKEKNT